MNLWETKNGQVGIVTLIDGYNHECRMHGIKIGTMINMTYHYSDKMVVIIINRDTVTIPKSIAKHIEIEVIK